MNEQPKDQNPRHHSFETGRTRRRNTAGRNSGKARRVSQRKELAVVTLGAVASIAGLGGFLAANPPSWATAPQNAAPEIAATAEADPDGVARREENTWQGGTGTDSTPVSAGSAPVQRQEEAPAPPVEEAPPAASRLPAEEVSPAASAPPAWSAPPRAPAAAESRGS